jgi:hypothetical protein
MVNGPGYAESEYISIESPAAGTWLGTQSFLLEARLSPPSIHLSVAIGVSVEKIALTVG